MREILSPAELSPAACERIGHRDIATTWMDFYQEALRSDDSIIIKTHKPPIDEQPAIYIIRDGRASCYSYLRYHESFLPEAGRSLLQIILGDDFYGDWSSHFRSWNQGSRPLLLLKYEDLIDPEEQTLASIAEFINFKGKMSPWQNPMSELKNSDPHFFRQGRRDWLPPPEWSRGADTLFWLFHSELMKQMGYGEMRGPGLSSDFVLTLKELGDIILKKIGECHFLQHACDQRIHVINDLCKQCDTRLHDLRAKDLEIRKLLGVCEERLELVERLSGMSASKCE